MLNCDELQIDQKQDLNIYSPRKMSEKIIMSHSLDIGDRTRNQFDQHDNEELSLLKKKGGKC